MFRTMQLTPRLRLRVEHCDEWDGLRDVQCRDAALAAARDAAEVLSEILPGAITDIGLGVVAGRAVAVLGNEAAMHGVALLAEHVDPAGGRYRFRPVTQAEDAAMAAAEMLKLASGGGA